MIRYLSGSVCSELLALGHPRIGAMFQPRSYGMDTVDRWPFFAADCGGYRDRFNRDAWLRFLDGIALRADRCLFAVVPDRFDPEDLAGNHAATLERWELYRDEVTWRELVPAFVAQNGCRGDDIPPEAGALFVGGDTRWKLSEDAWAVVATARAHGLHTHLGRVNGRTRMWAGSASGIDTADGNILRHGYRENIHRVLAWLDETTQPHLPLFGPTS